MSSCTRYPTERTAEVVVLKLVLLMCLLSAMVAVAPVGAGAFMGIESSIFADEEAILHPFLYIGSNPMPVVRVCIDPSSQSAPRMVGPVVRAINTINGLASTLGNTSQGGGLPPTSLDFESVALHELLHCTTGLWHSNVGVAPGVTGLAEFSTASTTGPNGSYNVNLGGDGIPGSSDDVRGDDQNRFWFSKSTNNPFQIVAPVSSATYSQDLADLPIGHSFAASGNRALSVATGLPETEAVMSTPQFQGELRRMLSPDEVGTIQYARTGLDQAAGTGDDYVTTLTFGGLSAGSECQVILKMDVIPTIAQCMVSSISISSSRHFRLAGTGRISFMVNAAWYFSDPIFADGFESGGFGNWVIFP